MDVGVAQIMAYFVEEVRKIPPPQTREWKILVVQARNGNDYARERPILMYIGTIMKNAYDFSCANHTDFEDSFQDGLIRLITAVEKYDVTSPETFVSFFPMWGWQGMTRYAIFSGAATTYPVHVKDKIFKIFAKTRELSEVLELDKIDEYYSWEELLEMAEDEYAVCDMFPYIELTEESELLFESPYEGIEDLEIKNMIKEALFNLKRLVLRGRNSSFDMQNSGYKLEDYSFSHLKARYHKVTKNSFDNKFFASWNIADGSGNLTNAGALLADESPVWYSRVKRSIKNDNTR